MSLYREVPAGGEQRVMNITALSTATAQGHCHGINSLTFALVSSLPVFNCDVADRHSILESCPAQTVAYLAFSAAEYRVFD
jgi:hypothetical protein